MSYFRRPNPRSNWRRPKPKIYDCNTRDIENFYQSSYGSYLNNKEDIRARELDRERRGDAESLTRRFEQRRASSLVYGEDDTPRTRYLSSRQTSNDGSGSNEHTMLRTSLQKSSDEGAREAIRSSTSSTRNVSFSNSHSLNAPDQNSEMASIESRLERLRKLREELGLPSEINTNDASSSSMSSSVMSSIETSSANRQRRSPSETRGRETSRFNRHGATTRSDSLSRTSPTRTGTETSSYSSRSERTAARNGLDDSTSSYTSKSRTTRGGDTNGFSSSSYESPAISNTGRSRQRVEKPSLDGIDMNFDDDALLTDMRKKIPSSSEILERIRNMEID